MPEDSIKAAERIAEFSKALGPNNEGARAVLQFLAVLVGGGEFKKLEDYAVHGEWLAKRALRQMEAPTRDEEPQLERVCREFEEMEDQGLEIAFSALRLREIGTRRQGFCGK